MAISLLAVPRAAHAGKRKGLPVLLVVDYTVEYNRESNFVEDGSKKFFFHLDPKAEVMVPLGSNENEISYDNYNPVIHLSKTTVYIWHTAPPALNMDNFTYDLTYEFANQALGKKFKECFIPLGTEYVNTANFPTGPPVIANVTISNCDDCN